MFCLSIPIELIQGECSSSNSTQVVSPQTSIIRLITARWFYFLFGGIRFAKLRLMIAILELFDKDLNEDREGFIRKYAYPVKLLRWSC